MKLNENAGKSFVPLRIKLMVDLNQKLTIIATKMQSPLVPQNSPGAV